MSGLVFWCWFLFASATQIFGWFAIASAGQITLWIVGLVAEPSHLCPLIARSVEHIPMLLLEHLPML